MLPVLTSFRRGVAIAGLPGLLVGWASARLAAQSATAIESREPACARPNAARSMSGDSLLLGRSDVAAGSPSERWLIDEAARVIAFPIAVRPFAPLTADRLRAVAGWTRPCALWNLSPMWSAAWVNTARAYSENSGPVWAGRGLTFAASAGVSGQWHSLSYAVHPIAFWSQNSDYRPSKDSRFRGAFQNPWFQIDWPYRFGPSSYARGDWGESFLRADTRWLAAGFSNEAQVWGPARIHPLILGKNAGGFPHVFVETGTPRGIGIGTVSVRWMAGRLVGSAFPPPRAQGARIAIGGIGSFMPRGFNGLELGASRFFELYDSPYARDIHSLLLPFQDLFKHGIPNADVRGPRQNNQLADVFFRVAPTGSGVDVYGEFYRDDHSADLRDLVLEPDHASGYMLGAHRYWAHGASRASTLTVEVVNGRISHLERVRLQGIPYTNGFIGEGHTLRGMPLGSIVLPGGGALTMSFERRDANGAWTAMGEVAHSAQNQEGGSWNDEMTGYYTIGLGREMQRRGVIWATDVRVQPGFGDVPGTNVQLSLRATR